MAIDYSCGIAARVSVSTCRQWLVRDLDLAVSESPDWLENKGLTVMLRDYMRYPPQDTELEIAQFTPRLHLRMRPVLTGETLDLACKTMIRVVDCLLRRTAEDLYFSYEWERMLLVRRSGRVLMRERAEKYFIARYKSLITVPFEEAPLKP